MPALCYLRERFQKWRQTGHSPGRLSGEEGQSLVVGALSIMAIMLLAALLVDGSQAFVQRRKVQNASDAASFAGARALSLGASDAQILSTVREYAITRNGAASFTATYQPGNQPVGGGSVPASAKGISVTVKSASPTFLAGAVGLPEINVSAPAKAAFGGIAQPGGNVQPLADKCPASNLEACGFQYGQSYDIWEGEDPGNFGWLSFDGSNNSPGLIDELTYGNVPNYIDPHGVCTEIAVGCWVQGRPGVKNASGVREQLDWWIDHPSSPMIVIIYDRSEGSGSHANYLIKGFAAFTLQDYDLPHGRVTGKFVKWMLAAPVTGDGNNYGLTSVHLTR